MLEPGLAEMVSSGRRAARLTATTRRAAAVRRHRGVARSASARRPRANGSLDTDGLERVASRSARRSPRPSAGTPSSSASTVLPGTTEAIVIRRCSRRRRGAVAGDDFGVAVNPEFLREGSSRARTSSTRRRPSSASSTPASGDAVAALYEGLPGRRLPGADPRRRDASSTSTTPSTRSRSRFANEIGAVCRALGVDSHEVMRGVPGRPQAEHRARLPDARLRLRRLVPAQGPARAWCTPRARADVDVPMLENVLPSNERAPAARASSWSRRTGTARIGLFGLVLQARHRRPAREPARRAGRAAHRQGLRPADLRPTWSVSRADRREPRVHRGARLPHLVAAARGLASTRWSSTPRCAWSARRPAGGGRALAARRADRIDRRPRPPARRREAPATTVGVRSASPGRRAHPRREPVGAVRPAGVAGVPRAARRGLGGHVICPQGQKQDREPYARDRRRRRSTATRCAPPPAARPATCASTARRCGTSWRLGAARLGAVRRRPRLQPARPAVPARPAAEAARRAARLRPARPGARAVPVALRPGRGPAATAVACCARAADLPARRRRDRDERVATGESRSSAAASGPRTSSSCAARPISTRFRQVPPDPALKRGKPHLLVLPRRDGPAGRRRPRAARAGRRCARTARRLARDLHRRRRRLRPRCAARAASSASTDRVEFTGRIPDEDVLRDPVDRRRLPGARSAEPAQRRVDDEQDRRVHGDGPPVVSFDLLEARVSAGDAALYAEPNDEADFARCIDDAARR